MVIVICLRPPAEQRLKNEEKERVVEGEPMSKRECDGRTTTTTTTRSSSPLCRPCVRLRVRPVSAPPSLRPPVTKCCKSKAIRSPRRGQARSSTHVNSVAPSLAASCCRHPGRRSSCAPHTSAGSPSLAIFVILVPSQLVRARVHWC